MCSQFFSESDDEFSTGSSIGVRFGEPTRYIYPDAHPELEAFPRSAAEALKRKNAPQTASPSSTIATKKPKIEGSGSRGRVITADFPQLTKSVLGGTCSKYRVGISAQGSFLSRMEERDLAAGYWVDSCEERHVRVEFDEDLLKIVSISNFGGPRRIIANRSHRLPLVVRRYEVNSKPMRGPSSRPSLA